MNNSLKKILASAGLLGAFGLGGAAIAGAQGDNPAASPTAQAQSQTADPADGGKERDATEQKVTGADANRAGQTALRSVGDGKVLSVERETPDQGADRAEPGDKPDSASEQAVEQETAYSVEVQKTDGTTVEVALDDTFNVLASQQDDEGGSEQAGEQAGETPAQR